MEERMPRTFVALDLQPELRDALTQVQRHLDPSLGMVYRWNDPGSMHLTLKFLGEVSESDLEIAKRMLRRVRSTPIHLPCSALLAMPSVSEPRVLVISFEERKELAELEVWVREHLSALGEHVETRKFAAHVTIGRLRRHAAVPAAVLQRAASQIQAASLPPLEADKVVLYTSQLGAGTASYRAIEEVPLCG